MDELATRRLLKSPHREGNARCLSCKHQWVAVAPAGTTTLECPSCATFQGVYLGVAQTENAQWQCACGEFVFFIDAHGPYCAHCGIRPSYA